ncbi:MAG: FAD-dependent oxidoreductase [Acidobacteriota bacterium]|nr:FAD-dependent oxidoreductase [Acidobacteriota bacterium]
MANFKVELTKKEEAAEGTMAFYFTKPRGFDFQAGQFIDVTLIDPPETDSEGNTRAFTLASSPHEDYLMVATRLRNTAFKRVLHDAPVGSALTVEGPMGSFTLHRNTAKPAVFLAGGIGVTPFLSIIRQAAWEQAQRTIHLFYSNRRPEDSAFLEQLVGLAQEGTGIHLVATMTEMEKSRRTWAGEKGFINKTMLLRNIQSLAGPIYYIAGPPGMVASMRHMLADAGVDEDDVRTEEFSGY